MPQAEHPESNPELGEAPVLSTTQARQGRRGRHVLWVLVISMGLIGAIYAVMVGGVWGGRLSQPGGQTTVDRNTAQTFQTQPSTPRESAEPQTAPTATPPADKS